MREERVAIALILRQGRYFLQRRALDAAFGPGLWEFPGGKLEPAESPVQALLRELIEEVGHRPARCTALAPLRHCYPDRAVTLHPFLCEGGDQPRTGLAWGWFTRPQLERLPMPAANPFLLPGMP